MVPATVFFYFFFALGYVAKLIGIDTVVMSVTSAVSNAAGNQVKNSQFFHYF
jgi:tRNA/tmRNA/rRNA uracil-C5-methylase (TrmA/RlmC/RlmD family)